MDGIVEVPSVAAPTEVPARHFKCTRPACKWEGPFPAGKTKGARKAGLERCPVCSSGVRPCDAGGASIPDAASALVRISSLARELRVSSTEICERCVVEGFPRAQHYTSDRELASEQAATIRGAFGRLSASTPTTRQHRPIGD